LVPALPVERFSRPQRSEQYLTSFQFFSHFRRQAKGSPHVAQVFVGRSPFLIIFAISAFHPLDRQLEPDLHTFAGIKPLQKQ